MKYCPICEKSYGDEAKVCDVDGATLREAGTGVDAFIGHVIKGRYQVLKKLGAGGMGTVYLAEQVSIGRRVALKVLHGQYAGDEEFVRRFRHEARLAASLNHRNIVTVYDFDQGDDASLFIAMEYVDGQSLTEVIKREGPLDVGRAVRLGVQIGEGLEAAHRAGVIHRDIKPDNIMVMAVGEKEEVKLMDFGIARLRDTGSATRLTRAGVIMGTPAYMAPEQIEGGADVSERTDIYALGVVLYEMLSGGVPFRASTPGSVLIKQLREVPVSLIKLRREVPAGVEKVVMQALEKKPQKRQRDMGEVAQGLKQAIDTLGEGELPRPFGESWPLWQSIAGTLQGQKNRIYISVTVILGIALIVWFGGPLLGKREGVIENPTRPDIPAIAPKAEPKGPDPKIQEHINLAKSFWEQGKFSDALKELEKARSIDPTDKAVKDDIESTRRVCLAARKYGLTEDRCD